MNQRQLRTLTDRILDKLYGLCFAITFDRDQSAQLLSDAYTVFTLSEKSFLNGREFDMSDSAERSAMSKFLFSSLAKVIIDIAAKKTRSSLFYKDLESEYSEFSQLTLQSRGLVFLKEKINLSLNELQDIFDFERFKVVELYRNSLYKLKQGSELSDTKSVSSSLRSQISAYVDKTLPQKLILSIEKSINSTEESFTFYQEKLREKEFTDSLIPDFRPEGEERKNVRAVLDEINKIAFPKDKFEFFKKTARFLTTPIIEI